MNFHELEWDELSGKLSLVREARLVHGRAAAKKLWGLLNLPNCTSGRDSSYYEGATSLDDVDRWMLKRLREGTTTRFHSEWLEKISLSWFVEDFSTLLGRRSQSQRSIESTLGMRLRRYFPQLSKRRDYGGGGRAWIYYLPPLIEAREDFERFFNQPSGWASVDDDRPIIRDSNFVSDFLEDCTLSDPDGTVSRDILYGEFERWSSGNDVDPGLSPDVFSQEVARRGISVFHSDGIYFRGIRRVVDRNGH